MKNRYGMTLGLILMAAIVLGGMTPLAARDYPGGTSPKPFMLQGRLEIQFGDNVDVGRMAKGFGRINFAVPTLDRILDKYQVSDAEALFPWRKGERVGPGQTDMTKFFELVFPESVDINAIMSELSHNPYVRSVAPVFAMPVSASPNDLDFWRQWGYAKIMAPAAWDSEKGSDTAIIAIADTGVLYTHPDLADKIWVNPGEDIDSDGVVYDTDDLNGIDDDGNGVVDDLIGYDFFSGFSGVTCWAGEDCSGPDTDPKDFNGHGTNCSGIAAATTNNSIGGAGLAGGWGGGWGPYRGPRIMCLRVGGSAVDPGTGYEAGYVNTANCAQAIDYASKMGACAINASWGSQDSPAMRAACNRANDSGVVIAHAAGNDDNTVYGFLDSYSYNGYSVALSVASTDGDDRKSTFSNYGPWIDVCAPGTYIYNTYSNHYTPGYAYLDGTSMAAPHVVGLAALIKSHMPQLKKFEIDSIIMNHADTIDYLNPLYVGMLGAGRINACSSLSIFPVAAFSAGPTLLGPAPLPVNFTDQSPVTPSAWLWHFGDGASDVVQNPSHTYNQYGLYTVSMTATTPKGEATEVLKKLVMVTADTLKVDSVSARIGTQVVLPVYLNNKFQAKTIIFPFALTGSYDINLDSFSVVGTRTDYFQEVKYLTYDPIGMRFTISLRSNLVSGSNYLKPGAGIILKLYVTVLPSAPGSQVVTIDTLNLSGRSLKLQSIYGDYVPVFKPGKIMITAYARGDANMDTKINVLDMSYLINYLYKGGPPPDPYAGDVNASGGINIIDVTYLINFLYKGGPPPPL